MKKLTPGLIIGMLLLTGTGLYSASEKVVAVVNGEDITVDYINKKLYLNYFRQALDDAINEKLILQEAKKRKIELDKKEFEDFIKQIKSRFKSEKEFKEELKKNHISEKDYYRIIKNNLLVEKTLSDILNINITDEDAKKFYEQNKNQFVIPKSYKLRQIFVNTEQEANDIYLALKAGADFEKLAELKSADDRLKKAKGDIGYITKGMLNPEIEKEVFSLKPGEYTKPIKTGPGYSIIKVDEIREEKKLSFDEVKDKLKAELKNRILFDNRQRIIEQLKKKSKIVIK